MLQNIHDKAKGWVAYAIVGFIAVPFALFGISSYLGGSNSLVAATVNGEDIPIQQVQNGVLQQRQRLTQMFGGKLPANFSSDAIKKQVLESEINKVLLRQEAEENGYRASNQEVYDTIASIQAFQKNGVFDVETYERLLASQRRNKTGFETEIRESISNQQFAGALSRSAFVPVNEATRYQRLQNQTRNVETYTLKKSDYKVSVSDDEVKTYFDKNASQFMTTEKVKLSYIEIKKAGLAKSIEVSDDELLAFYDENIGRYTDPEQRKVSHILIKIDDEKDGADAEKKAKEKAQAFSDQIKNGSKTFEDLATNKSDDKFSAKKSGDMGLIARGDMGTLFDKVAFSLKKGEISAPTKAEAGFEIIKVTDIVPSVQKSFADVKEEVSKSYRDEQAEKLFFDNSDKIQTLAFEDDSTLDTAADAIGTKVLTSDWITKGTIASAKANTLFSSPKLLAAAFSDEVLVNGKNSELLEIDSETVALIRVQEHQVPKQKALADVSSNIKNILTNQKLRKVLIEKGEKVLAELKKTGNWSALKIIDASEDKLVKITALKRTDNKVPKVLVDKIFSMQKPLNGKTSFDNVILSNGDYALIGLTGVKDGEVAKDSVLQAGFAREVGSREQQAMLKALREQADVSLFLENIQ